MDCSSPGSSVHGIFQARILEWVAIPFPRGSSRFLHWQADSLPLSHQGSPTKHSLSQISLFLSPSISFPYARMHTHTHTHTHTHIFNQPWQAGPKVICEKILLEQTSPCTNSSLKGENLNMKSQYFFIYVNPLQSSAIGLVHIRKSIINCLS